MKAPFLLANALTLEPYRSVLLVADPALLGGRQTRGVVDVCAASGGESSQEPFPLVFAVTVPSPP